MVKYFIMFVIFIAYPVYTSKKKNKELTRIILKIIYHKLIRFITPHNMCPIFIICITSRHFQTWIYFFFNTSIRIYDTRGEKKRNKNRPAVKLTATRFLKHTIIVQKFHIDTYTNNQNVKKKIKFIILLPTLFEDRNDFILINFLNLNFLKVFLELKLSNETIWYCMYSTHSIIIFILL